MDFIIFKHLCFHDHAYGKAVEWMIKTVKKKLNPFRKEVDSTLVRYGKQYLRQEILMKENVLCPDKARTKTLNESVFIFY